MCRAEARGAGGGVLLCLIEGGVLGDSELCFLLREAREAGGGVRGSLSQQQRSRSPAADPESMPPDLYRAAKRRRPGGLQGQSQGLRAQLRFPGHDPAVRQPRMGEALDFAHPAGARLACP